MVLTKDTLSKTTELEIGLVEGITPILAQGLLFSVDQNGGAAIKDPLRCTLHYQQITLVSLIFSLVHRNLKYQPGK